MSEQYPYGGPTPPTTALPTAPPPPPAGSFVTPYVQPQLMVAAKPTYPDRGKAVASMVLGIVAWGLAICIPFVGGFLAFVVGCVGLPLGIVALRSTKRNSAPRGTARAGFILNVVGIALAVLVVVLYSVAFSAAMATS